MIHEVLAVGQLEMNCQILGDERTRKAIVVDPGDDLDGIFAVLARHHLTVQTIVISHAHIDHMAFAGDFQDRTGAPALLHPAERPLYDNFDGQCAWLGIRPPKRFRIDGPIQGGDTLSLGDTVIEVRDTPGHSPGSVSLYIPSEHRVIAADALFRRSIGRTDLPLGDHATLLASIRTQLFTLPPATVVYPGHGPRTTIGEEISENPFFA